MPTLKLTKTVCDDAEPKATEYVLWDAELRGLGLKVTPAGGKVFVLFYRTADGMQRKPKVGTYGAITLVQAREIARDMLAKVHGGGDPSGERQRSRTAPTVNELCDKYLTEHADIRKKASSASKDRRNIKKHVRPSLGSLRVAKVVFEDVDALHRSMSETPGAANRILAVLSKMFNLAERWGWRAQGTNPTRHVSRYPENKQHRALTSPELARLAKVLIEAEQPAPEPKEGEDVDDVSEDSRAVAAIRLLMFTGMRRGEVLALKWSEVDLAHSQLNITEAKEHREGSKAIKVVRLNSAAKEVIEAQKRVVGSPYVFPMIGHQRKKGDGPGHMQDLNGPWYRIRKLAKIEGVRLHDLRHTFATVAIGQNLSLQVVGKLLGHKVAATTDRYADLQTDAAQIANEQVGAALKAAMEAKPGGKVVKLKAKNTRAKKAAKR